MQRRAGTVVLLLLVAVSCGKNKPSAGDPAAAHALLDQYMGTVDQVAKGGSLEELAPQLAEQGRKAAELKATGAVSDEFFSRHQRLLQVTRAATTPAPGEAEKKTILDFLDSVEGKKERVLEGGLAQIGPALVEEILSLHMLADGTSDRAAARQKYLGGAGG
jgi:hypothetical protein